MIKNNKRIYTILSIFIFLFALSGFVNGVLAGTQVVKIQPDAVVALTGEDIDLKMIYDVIAGDKKTTGLAIRIHYNSKVIDSLTIEDAYGEGMVGQNLTPIDDTKNYDNDPETDKYMNIAWIGILGGWPRILELPGQIGKVLIKTKPESNISKTYVRVTAKETAKGYDFKESFCEIIIQ